MLSKALFIWMGMALINHRVFAQDEEGEPAAPWGEEGPPGTDEGAAAPPADKKPPPPGTKPKPPKKEGPVDDAPLEDAPEEPEEQPDQGSPSTPSKQPNVILLLIDDLGWSDISAQGGEFPTPRIDELYKDSIKLNRNYIHMMCSPSRTQWMTGRYAMYQGINKMTPWDYTEIGGVPLGQPVITQWLKALSPETRTYGVGKWHLGYAYDGLCPMERGFDEWYGFLQGAVNYATKLYDDVKYGPTEFYDFWYNDEIDYSAEGPNSMYQYRDRFNEMMADHKENYNDKPFFVYAPLQAIHGPLRRVEAYKEACYAYLGDDVEMSRARYCENTFLMDAMIGDMIDAIKDNGFWDDTILVFGTDNGANLDNNGVNFPLRGTKGTLFEGNIRTIAFVTGGEKLIPRSENPEENIRHSLTSNLDFVPTVLDFTGLLDKIEEEDHTWDGVSAKDLILHGDEHKSRDHLVLNVGLESLESCSIIFEHEDKLYKYIHSSDDTIDRWSWYRVNGWSEYDEDGHVVMLVDPDEEGSYEYLYELIGDEREQHNLILGDKDQTWHNARPIEASDGRIDEGDDEEGEEEVPDKKLHAMVEEVDPRDQYVGLIDKAIGLIKPYTEHPLYSERIECLWHRIPNGDPSLLDDGKSVRPFLSRKGYLQRVQVCFDQDAEIGKLHSDEKKTLYNEEWVAPGAEPITHGGKKGKKKGKMSKGTRGEGQGQGEGQRKVGKEKEMDDEEGSKRKHKKKDGETFPLAMWVGIISALVFMALYAVVQFSFMEKKKPFVTEITPLLS